MSTELYEKACEFYMKGRTQDAEDCCLQSISSDAYDFESYNLLGMIYTAAKKYGLAEIYLHKALEVNKDCAESHSNLGNLYTENSLFAEAKYYYQKAINLRPDFAEAHYNLGTLLYKEKNYVPAFHHLNKALQYKPFYPEAYNNIGNILNNCGDLQGAIECFGKAIELMPGMMAAYTNHSYAVLYMKGVKAWEEVLEEYIKKCEFKEPEFLNNLAIAKWISGKMAECELLTNAACANLQKYNDSTNYKQTEAYNIFLKALICWYNKNNNDPDFEDKEMPAIYFIGDSHSITCANKIIKIGSENFIAKTHFIMGCKIWHLVNKENNQYKIAFNREFSLIPANSILVLTIGEIDCRTDQGIFRIYTNKGISWKDSTDFLVSSYFRQVIDPVKTTGIIPVVWGIPAPHKKTVEELAINYQAEYIDFIKYFNEQMYNACLKNHVQYIDNYSVSSSERGVAKKNVKLDQFHLNPDIFVNAIQKAVIEELLALEAGI